MRGREESVLGDVVPRHNSAVVEGPSRPTRGESGKKIQTRRLTFLLAPTGRESLRNKKEASWNQGARCVTLLLKRRIGTRKRGAMWPKTDFRVRHLVSCKKRSFSNPFKRSATLISGKKAAEWGRINTASAFYFEKKRGASPREEI